MVWYCQWRSSLLLERWVLSPFDRHSTHRLCEVDELPISYIGLARAELLDSAAESPNPVHGIIYNTMIHAVSSIGWPKDC